MSARRPTALGAARALAAGPALAFEAALDALAARLPDFGVDPDEVHLARALIDLVPGLDDPDRLAGITLVLATAVGHQQGSTRIPLDPDRFLGEVVARLLPDAEEAGARLERIEDLLGGERLAPILGDAPQFRPLIRTEAWLEHQRVRAREERVAQRLTDLLDAERAPSAPRADVQAAWQDVLTRAPTDVALTPHQQLAALAPFLSGGGLTLIVGPPGSGKTATVGALLRLAYRLGLRAPEIALAAPTAKAANRIRESLTWVLDGVTDPSADDGALTSAPPPATTLHRLLGWSPGQGRFRHDAARPLPQRLVIVDEASMIDLALADGLLAALGPEARLVLVGDPDQLPPVGVGAILAELIPVRTTTRFVGRDLLSATAQAALDSAGERDPAPSNAAERVTRFLPADHRTAAGADGATLRALAAAVRSGATAEVAAALTARADAAALTFAGAEAFAADGTSLPAFLDAWQARFLQDAEHEPLLARSLELDERGGVREADVPAVLALLAHRARAQLLAVTHHGPRGVNAINAALHERHLAALGRPSTTGLVPGDPLLFTTNAYDLGLFNGDVGVVLRCAAPHDDRPRLRAVFLRDGHPAAFALDQVRERSAPAWALTVHRAQGSEYDAVGLILPERPLPLLARRLVYTALTRARRSVVVVGAPELLAAGVERDPQRWCGLRERLAHLA